jgi:hypothetical protein
MRSGWIVANSSVTSPYTACSALRAGASKSTSPFCRKFPLNPRDLKRSRFLPMHRGRASAKTICRMCAQIASNPSFTVSGMFPVQNVRNVPGPYCYIAPHPPLLNRTFPQHFCRKIRRNERRYKVSSDRRNPKIRAAIPGSRNRRRSPS